MKKILLITQGSQGIQLIREFYSLGIRPEDLTILTLNETGRNVINYDFSNLSFLRFIQYYKIKFEFVSKLTFDDILNKHASLNDVVISFSNPFIIKKDVLKKSTFINFHPGILPNYRGSLSTVWSMLNDESYVGGTWHYIEERVDTGNILSKHKIPITSTSTAFSLNHKIFSKGISEIGDVLEKVNNNDKGIKQEGKSKFYYNQFPSLSNESKFDEDLKRRVNYFPPSFND